MRLSQSPVKTIVLSIPGLTNPTSWVTSSTYGAYPCTQLRRCLARLPTQVYLIVDKVTSKPAGALFQFHPYTESSYHGLEIGYIVHQDSRGKGLATQASSMLINHIFDSTQIERILATVVVGNLASCRVLEKAGMKLEGVERKKFFLHGKFRDTRLYSIIRDEWVDEPTYKLNHPF